MLLNLNDIKKIGEAVRPQKPTETEDVYMARVFNAICKEQLKTVVQWLRSSSMRLGEGTIIAVPTIKFQEFLIECD